jgi:hypothetical protein
VRQVSERASGESSGPRRDGGMSSWAMLFSCLWLSWEIVAVAHVFPLQPGRTGGQQGVPQRHTPPLQGAQVANKLIKTMQSVANSLLRLVLWSPGEWLIDRLERLGDHHFSDIYSRG